MIEQKKSSVNSLKEACYMRKLFYTQKLITTNQLIILLIIFINHLLIN